MKTLDVSSADFLDIAESPSYNRLSFGGASVSFRVPVSRFSSCPFEEGEIIKIVWRGKTLLIGPVINPEHALEGTSESWDIRICDYWWNLSNIQYFVNGRANGIFAEYRYGTGGSGQEKQATANIRDALSGVLDHAIGTARIPIKYDLRIDEGAEIIPFAYSSETYASLLTQIQKWRPNMSAWFEYGADDSATLVIADHAGLPDIVLDMSSVDVSTLSLKARPDLVPPAVGLTCNASVVSQVQRAVAVYPPDATLSQPYVVTAEVDVPGGVKASDTTGQFDPVETGSLGYDTPRMIVRGDKFPTGKAQWAARVKRWAPVLADCANLEVAGNPDIMSITPADAEHRGYSSAAISHELISGQINGKSKRIKWGKVRVDLRVRATNPPETAKQYFPEYGGRNRWIGTLTFEVTTTNVGYASYRVDRAGTVESVSDDSGGPEDGETPGNYDASALYKNFLKAYYESTRALPYDGSATVHDDFDQVCGGRLSITGGLKEWETMRSVIQEISLDLRTGVSDVTVGAAEQISLQDSIDRSRQLAEALRRTAWASTSDGGGSSGGGSDSGGGGSSGADDEVPELPSVGPSVKLLQAQEPPAWGTSAVEVGFQCRLEYGADGSVTGAKVHKGKAICGGAYLSSEVPQGGDNGWISAPSSGEIWLKVKVDKYGKLLSSELSGAGGESNPLDLSLPEEEREDGEYFFHLATIDGNKVKQYLAGEVYLIPKLHGPDQELNLEQGRGITLKKEDKKTVVSANIRNKSSASSGEACIIDEEDPESEAIYLRKIRGQDGILVDVENGVITISGSTPSSENKCSCDYNLSQGESSASNVIRLTNGDQEKGRVEFVSQNGSIIIS